MAQQADPLAALAAAHGIKIDIASDPLSQLATSRGVTTGAPAAAQATDTNSPADLAEGFIEAQPIHPIATGNALMHPLQTLQNMGVAQGRLAQEAQEAFASGDYIRGGRKAIEYLIPILGPIISKAGDDASKGQIMRAIGESLGAATNLMFLRGSPAVADSVSQVPGAARVGMGPGQLAAESPLGKTAPGPVMPQQIVPSGQMMKGVLPAKPGPLPPATASVAAEVSQFADAQNPPVPLPAGARTGNPLVRGFQQFNAKTSYPASMVEERKMGEYADAMRGAGENIAEGIASGKRPDADLAGASGRELLRGISDRYKQEQSEAYDAFRRLEQDPRYGRDVDVIQTGTAGGDTVHVPIKTRMQLPVSLRMAKKVLRPIFDRLAKQWPEARKASSPGYVALKNIVEGPDFMTASEVDGNLSGLKKIARETGGVAKAAVKQVEDALQIALEKADPVVRDALEAGRAATRSKVAVDTVVKKLHDNAQDPYRALALEDVERLHEVAPEAVPIIARGWLQTMMNRAFEAPGRFDHAAALYGQWMRVSPKVKYALYGPERMRTITSFFRTAAEVARQENPSGTAHQIGMVVSTSRVAGELAGALWNPMAAAGAAVIEIAQWQVAKALWNPTFSKLLTKGLRVKQGTPASYDLAAQLVNGARAMGVVTAPAQEVAKAAEQQAPPSPDLAQAPVAP